MEFAVREALSQLEHGPDSRAIVVACAPGLGRAFQSALAALSGPSKELAGRVEVYETGDPTLAWRFADALAPESLLVALADDRAWEKEAPRCGSLFLGPWSAVAFGDYVSGTNHVLPVSGAARFSGGLSVYDFGRWTASQRLTPSDARDLAPYGAAIAGAEGMRWHAESQKVRGAALASGAGPTG
jgi:histidinol dehydrogenase